MYNLPMKKRAFLLLLPLLASCAIKLPSKKSSALTSASSSLADSSVFESGSSSSSAVSSNEDATVSSLTESSKESSESEIDASYQDSELPSFESLEESDSDDFSTHDGSSNESSAQSHSSSDASNYSSATNSSSECDEYRTIDIYAINDFHGAVKQTGAEAGIASLGSYFKRRGAEDNTLLISSGDMFQGSLESNYNRGNLLADVMNECHFDAMTLGNHEFDWGKEALKANKDRVGEDGYQTPYLCANLYDYSSGVVGNVQQSDYGEEYTISVQENGLRVGIIGAIGEDQITSISSQFMTDFTFKEPTSIIESLSDRLRTEENCDVVLLSFHANQETLINASNDVTAISPVSNKRYVDAVFCAHTHKFESSVKNGVVFTQNNSNGTNASHLTLTVSPDGEVTSSLDDLQTIYPRTMRKEMESLGEDEGISSLVERYGKDTETLGSENVATLSGEFSYVEQLPNLVATAILEEAKNVYPEVALAMTNKTRSNLSEGTLTYSSLFSAIPFDNEICIIDVDGEDIIKEANYNYICRSQREAFVSGSTYRIAVIDYLALHQNARRAYDYFPSAELVCTIKKDGYDLYNYRDITYSYLKSQSGVVSSSDYSSSLARHDRSSISSSVSL